MKPEVSVSAELDFRELFEQNGKLAVRYIETLQAVIAAQDKCIFFPPFVQCVICRKSYKRQEMFRWIQKELGKNYANSAGNEH